jgi:hypothetical protein
MPSSGSTYSQGRISIEKALQKLKHYCGYQGRCQAEVKQKLYSLGLLKKDVEELISRLIEEGYSMKKICQAIRFRKITH